jgi:DNA polymerase III subunit delta'
MALAEISHENESVQLLQRSLERGRLGHAYLFSGLELGGLERVARALAKTLVCEQPPKLSGTGLPMDSCDHCLSCRKVDEETHPDVIWVRPESKLRVVTIDQMRDLMQTIHLKPTQAPFKVAVIVSAERLNVQAANAFLKTLEEPPADSILVLLTTEPQRILETIVSRCLRLNFAGGTAHEKSPEFLQWLEQFAGLAAAEQRSLLSRYQLLSVMLNRLNETKARITDTLTKRSPLERYDDLEPKLRDRFETELDAAIEAEYRRQRTDLLAGLEWWFRDVWLRTLGLGEAGASYPSLAPLTDAVAKRVRSDAALKNIETLEQTQRLLATNVQEALALEVGFLKLNL